MYGNTHIVNVSYLKDDPDLFDYNVQERVNDFVAAAYFQVHVSNFNGSESHNVFLSFLFHFSYCDLQLFSCKRTSSHIISV